MSLLRRLFAVRSVEAIFAELDSAPPLKRVLTASSLTAIGLGSTIGTGIFILTGTVAANHTGPGPDAGAAHRCLRLALSPRSATRSSRR